MSSSVSARLNASLLDEKYARWKADPRSVEPEWSAFFEGFEIGAQRSSSPFSEATDASSSVDLARRALVVSMIYNYRLLGHSQADVNPLRPTPPRNNRLSLAALGFSESDLDREVSSAFFHGSRTMRLREMIQTLETIYCGKIGFEFMHIQDDEVRHWLRDRVEERIALPPPAPEEQKQVLQWLIEAETFEQFLHRKYVGQKRFGLEGGESLIVALQTLVDQAPSTGIQHLVMGMAHRGRLNVLANLLRKPLKVIFYEFSENYVPNVVMGDGDVKYHLGYETVRELANGYQVGLSLAANPSHLEAVNSVVEGKARARQRAAQFPEDEKVDRNTVVPVLIHGDAAFAGQGSVAEVLNLSQLGGYRTGGTIHLIVNNQIGFTTTPDDARSSAYCTDVAKMIEAPVFHVNGDCPLEVAFVTKLALTFRQTFNRDAVVDIVCYRRHGHNEGDEPTFTLPNLYRTIRTWPSPARIFEAKLRDSGVIAEGEARELQQSLEHSMDEELAALREEESAGEGHIFAGSTAVAQPPYSHDPFLTGIHQDTLRHVGRTLTQLPEGFRVNEKLDKRFLAARREATEQGGPFNWAFAESLAFGSLLLEGRSIRLSGQDCRRGTFSQRHAVLYDAETRKRHFPLRHLTPNPADQGRFYVYNSHLSEFAVLGFEYGYSLVAQDVLVLWEAQFGDFANGAQVIIDQFISSAESKWAQPSNVVMLLPHGYEGMGPEHSSARLERFLQLCAEDNIQVCNLTTPAQYFHLLRRQALRPVRKPLVIMTPKSLLSLPECVSMESDFVNDTCFHEMLDDPEPPNPDQVDRLIFCTGKVYFDLLKYRAAHGIDRAAIIRVEQLYPFHEQLLEGLVSHYGNPPKKWVWCQEEPQNMGPWTFVEPRLRSLASRLAGSPVSIHYAGRNGGASPAAGAKSIHVRQQARLVQEAFQG